MTDRPDDDLDLDSPPWAASVGVGLLFGLAMAWLLLAGGM